MPAESAMANHRPLTESDEMRLLTSYHDPGDDVLRFTLGNVSMAEAGNFVYLTLAVEESSETEVARINGEATVISGHLSRALQSLAAARECNVWVEEICVNQRSIEDRDQHIKLRPQLIRAARKVVCYTEIDKGSALSPEQLWQSVRAVDESNTEEQERAFDNLQSFFGRPVWSKMGLLQEIPMGHSSMLYKGQFFDWTHLGSALWKLQTYRKATGEQKPELWAVFCINNMWYRRNSMSTSASSTQRWETSTLDAVTWSAPLKTKDPRDRLFKLFGVCFDAEEMLRSPSYGKSIETVYTDFTKAIVDDFGLEVLRLVAGTRPGVVSYYHRLPSWVPDFRYPR